MYFLQVQRAWENKFPEQDTWPHHDLSLPTWNEKYGNKQSVN